MERATTTNLIGRFVMLLDRYSFTVEITNDGYFISSSIILIVQRNHLTDGISVIALQEWENNAKQGPISLL